MPKTSQRKSKQTKINAVYKPVTIGQKNVNKVVGIAQLKSILRRRSKEVPVKGSLKKVRVPRRSVSFSGERSFVKFERNAPPSQCIVERGVEIDSHSNLEEQLKTLTC